MTRMNPKAPKFYLVGPRDRFQPANPGGVGTGMQLHSAALRHSGGIGFGLNELTSLCADGRRFVAAQNFTAITRRFDLLKRTPGVLSPAWRPAWRLCDELPDTDVETGAAMHVVVVASRWQSGHAKVLFHLIKTRGRIA